MPATLWQSDVEIAEHFLVDDKVEMPAEYTQHGVMGVRVKCRKCDAAWILPLDENGCFFKGERNAVLMHGQAHKREGVRMRRLS
jgi:hypothetical protein